MKRASRMTTSLILAAAAACLPASAAAQAAEAPPTSRPEDSRVSIPALVYQTPFAQYRPLSESKVSSWKFVNDEVGRIGGWKVYARESYEAAVPAATGATLPNAPAQPPGTPAQSR